MSLVSGVLYYNVIMSCVDAATCTSMYQCQFPKDLIVAVYCNDMYIDR